MGCGIYFHLLPDLFNRIGQLPTCATRAQRTDPIALEKLVLSDAPWGTIVAGRAMQTARLIETGKSP